MSDRLIAVRQPRKLTKLELVDIHLLVKATRPMLRYEPPKPTEPKCSSQE